jgi:integrase
LDELFRTYLEYSETNHQPSTTRRYRQVIQNFQLYLTLKHPKVAKIAELNVELLEGFKRFRRTVDPRTLELPESIAVKVAPNALPGKTRTVNYELKTIRSMLRFGKKRGMCRENPCEDVTYLKVNDSKEPRFLSQDECRLLLEHAGDKYRPIFYAFLNTGLRLGELVNLQWGDIDFNRRILVVRRKPDWQPKTGEREVPLNAGMLELFDELKPPRASKRTYIFVHADGRKFGAKLRQALIGAAKRAGLDDVTKIHSLRHTFASHLVMSGVDLPTVQRLLGHSDIQTTMIYSHLAAEHIAEAVNKLDFA